MTPLWPEVRGAARLARRQPLFTSLLVAVLALGIGAAVAMFSVLNAVVLRALPYGEPHGLAFSLRRFGGDLQRLRPAENARKTAIQLTTLHERIVGDYAATLRLLFAAVAMVLLVACVNLASLTLARTSARQRELAVRVALGLGPALHMSRVDPSVGLRGLGGASPGRGPLVVRRWLVSAEVAISLVLAVATAFLVQSFSRVQEVDPGFATGHVLSMRVSLSKERYPNRASVLAFQRRLEERLQALPGAGVVGGASIMPLGGYATLAPRGLVALVLRTDGVGVLLGIGAGAAKRLSRMRKGRHMRPAPVGERGLS